MQFIPSQNIRWKLSILMLCCFSFLARCQDSDGVRILFVGNSFTYFYNLPQVVASMAESQDIDLITRQSTRGGSNLEQHWKSERGIQTRSIIENGNFDYVVFNNHSNSAIETPESFMEYGKKFAQLVKEKGGQPVFMMTWAYKSDPGMQDEITRMYTKLAEESQSDLVPAGLIFAKARSQFPDLNFFFDDKHPSYVGTYMLGLTFYKFFTGNPPIGIPERLTTTDKDGENLYLIFMHKDEAAQLQNLVNAEQFKTLKIK